jgi:hypothetical protein
MKQLAIIPVIVFLLAGLRANAQQIVFPYECKPTSMVRFSSNGEIMGILEQGENPFFYVVEAQSGHIIASTIFEGYEIVQFNPSFTGEYFAFIGIKNYETDLFFYQFNDVNELVFLNKIKWFDDPTDISPENFVIVPTFNNSFYIKVKNGLPGTFVKQYQSIHKYSNYYGTYSEDFGIGDLSLSSAEIGDNPLYLFKTNFMAYDLSADEKYLTILTDKKIKRKDLPKGATQDQYFSFAIVDWSMTGKKQTYTRLFTTDRQCESDATDPDLPVNQRTVNYDFLEGEQVYGLKYDAKARRVYGVGDKYALQELLRFEDGNKVETNYFLKYQREIEKKVTNQFWKDGKFHSMIPFYYDLDSGTFHSVAHILSNVPYISLNNPPIDSLDYMQTQKLLNEQSIQLGITLDHHFSSQLPYLYFVSTFADNNFHFHVNRINLVTNSIDHIDFFGLSTNPAMVFTSDDKLIIHDRAVLTGRPFSYEIIDLAHMIITTRGELPAKKEQALAYDVYFTRVQNERHLLLLADSNLVNFNFSAVPFYSLTEFGNDSPEKYREYIKNNEQIVPLSENTCTEQAPVDMFYTFSFFPLKHQVVLKSDGTTRFSKSKYEPDFSWAKSAQPEDVDAYTYDVGSPDEIISTADSVPGMGYDNLCIGQTGYAWHEFSKRLFVLNNKVIEKWNDQAHKAEYVYKSHLTTIHAFDVAFNDSLMVTASRDGKICIWNVFTNKSVADLYLFNGGADWIFILPDNYYYGTKETVKKIAFAFKLKALPIEFFELKYNRPDLVLKALGNNQPSLIKSFNRAYIKRLQKLKLDETMLQVDFDVPYLKITNEKLLPAQIEADSIELDLDMYDHHNAIDKINIYINGVLVRAEKISDAAKKNYLQRKMFLKIAYGVNKIEMSVSNDKGIESVKQKLEVYGNQYKTSDLYIVSIGASLYKQSSFNLTYAGKDANDFSALMGKSEGYRKVHVLNYIGEDVKVEILQAIKDSLKKSKPEDVIYIYYAGHGILDNKLDYYLGTWNIDFNKPSANGILYEDFENLVAEVPALQKTILLDACHSGEIEKDEVEQSDSVLVSENIIFRNVGAGIKNKEELNSSDILKNVFSEMRKGTGATIISSAGGAEYAMESAEWKNGLFTYCLLHGIKDKAADVNNDGNIMLSELQKYLRQEVTRLSNGKQQPTSRIENTMMDFKVW